MNGSLTRIPCTIVTGFLGAGKTTRSSAMSSPMRKAGGWR